MWPKYYRIGIKLTDKPISLSNKSTHYKAALGRIKLMSECQCDKCQKANSEMNADAVIIVNDSESVNLNTFLELDKMGYIRIVGIISHEYVIIETKTVTFK